jgi:predicted AlkP superfamily pyrophosphatase or phosphodiesterase
MRNVILVFAIHFSFHLAAQPDTSQKVIEGRRNSREQQQKPYVIMISADGFRYDYAEKYHAKFLQSIGTHCTKAEYMIPSYPSLTFPNHYTLATGLFPSHHGLVDNHFHDRNSGDHYSMSQAGKVREGKWYGGTPLWVLAEQQHLLTASFYWVGTEAPVKGILPTYYYLYNEIIPIEKRVQVVVDWLRLPEDRRPHFISLYLPEVDHAGHAFGPDATQTGEAVRFVDSALLLLTKAVKTTGLAVNYIFVSDHGMTKVDTSHPVNFPVIDSAKAIATSGSELVQLYVKNKSDIPSLYKQLKQGVKDYSVILKEDFPSNLHYGREDDRMNRIGDILLVPDWPFIFVTPGKKPKAGAHGFDPYKVPDMRAVFYAWGPGIKNKRVSSIRNVDVFPVVVKLLGLKNPGKIDGSKKLAKKIVK